MQVPRICYSKLFWTITSASIAFTVFVYGILDERIDKVDADNSHLSDQILKKIDVSNEKITIIQQDVSFIKGKIEGEK